MSRRCHTRRAVRCMQRWLQLEAVVGSYGHLVVEAKRNRRLVGIGQIRSIGMSRYRGWGVLRRAVGTRWRARGESGGRRNTVAAVDDRHGVDLVEHVLYL